MCAKHPLTNCPTASIYRLLRLYVSHAALIRPLNEMGKVKLTRDTAMIESAVSSKASYFHVAP